MVPLPNDQREKESARKDSKGAETMDLSPIITSHEPQETKGFEIDIEADLEPTLPTEPKYNSDGDEVVDSSKLRSSVWAHFQKVRLKGSRLLRARCLYCKKKLVAEPKSGTKHLTEHKCTSKKLAESKNSKQKTLTSSFMTGSVEDGKKKLEAYTYDPEFARRALACMIIMHEYPLSIVEHVGFRRYSYALQPLFHLVSRNTIKCDILKIYKSEKVKTMKLLDKTRGRVSVTTDMWTSSNQKRGYMVVTAHFIDDSWRLQSRILRFIYVPAPHTSEVLSELLIETFLEWNIERKISTLTVDNCTTNDAMVTLVLEKFGVGTYKWRSSLFHVRCSCHILNLIVKDGLEVIKVSIENIRDSVAFWTASPKRGEKFQTAVNQLKSQGIKFDTTKKLALDCPTRWNSTFLMLQNALVYKDVFKRLAMQNSQFKCCPSMNDWELSMEICERLKIFYNATVLFSGTKYPTSNLFFSNVCEIKIRLSEWTWCYIDVVRSMASEMMVKYDKYWQDSHGILGVAAVLDPRYKMKIIEYFFSKIYPDLDEDELAAKVNVIRKLCYDVLTLYEPNTSIPNSSMETSINNRSADALAEFDLFVVKQKKTKTSHVKSELEHCLEEEVLPRDGGDFDILGWWKQNGVRYPTLQAMAKDVLAIPVSTVASESSFSTSGRVVSHVRSRLHPKTFEALMCAQSWLFALENGGEPAMPNNRFATAEEDYDDDDDDDNASIVTSNAV